MWVTGSPAFWFSILYVAKRPFTPYTGEWNVSQFRVERMLWESLNVPAEHLPNSISDQKTEEKCPGLAPAGPVELLVFNGKHVRPFPVSPRTKLNLVLDLLEYWFCMTISSKIVK